MSSCSPVSERKRSWIPHWLYSMKLLCSFWSSVIGNVGAIWQKTTSPWLWIWRFLNGCEFCQAGFQCWSVLKALWEAPPCLGEVDLCRGFNVRHSPSPPPLRHSKPLARRASQQVSKPKAAETTVNTLSVDGSGEWGLEWLKLEDQLSKYEANEKRGVGWAWGGRWAAPIVSAEPEGASSAVRWN